MTSTRGRKAADDGIQRDLGDSPSGPDDLLGAAASPATAPAQDADSPAPGRNPKAAKKVKFPCGKCDTEVSGNSVCCNSCETWFHYSCVEGMSKEYFDNCKKTFDLYGFTAFLCRICRKVMASVKKSVKELKDDMKSMADQIVVLQLEKETLAQRLEKMELKTEKVSDRIVGVEKEVATGMEKAKEEVKKDVNSEIASREERGNNVVVYGLEETEDEGSVQWQMKEKEKVENVFRHMGVKPEGEITIKYRAGRLREAGAKPRPVVVKVADDETRMRFLRNAPKLSRVEETRRVYIAPDLTPQQQKEDREKETTLKEEAAKKSEEAKNGGETKRWIVVGGRGRRRVIQVEEKETPGQ